MEVATAAASVRRHRAQVEKVGSGLPVCAILPDGGRQSRICQVRGDSLRLSYAQNLDRC